ncbi:MAG: tRNA (N6-isopentenyl adenosine(37)-C2)-methylthiotransferase MiaB [Alphaproteobacteria bacterium]|jgi:tRNA-2-methylthio-N6-dimethylallyladenosine synthase|nr:tRNA (N6-isopentenyl adenosine(37)-C2)-methylthiotransferase MiaB [Alphaproteobacteria bacterium]MDP7222585.1 tRNA (N6-isopentenyl adenosine(37)-C2)-methylthiotransferase MiaB [Alphaproteobacteria bacterium]
MNENTQKKLYIKTWGCQMNVYDSNRMADILSPLGYKQVEAPDDADMVILNTCHIREKATDKVFSELGRLREHQDKKKENGGKMLMAVAGCVAQAEGDFIMKRAPYVDMVFGPQTYHELPEMVIRATGERVVNTEMVTESKFDKLPEENISQGPTAFLSIQEGCDKFCTFCVVPYTRGAEYSRSVREVVDEAKRLADTGAREITLLGQNVNAYHGEDETGKTWSLGRLIAAVADINGIERVRYSTSHPRDMDQELIDAHRDIPECMPFLHLPIQSGSNKLLKTMNRKHDRDLYFKIIEDVRKGRPDIALSSDFIVGFPGETDQDFEDTMDLIERVNFSSAYSFIYSPRPGTPAANMQQQLHDKIKSERLTRLQALLAEQQKQFNANTVGKDVTVIFDRRGRQDNQYLGRSEYNQAVHVVANEDLFGQMRKVRVTASTQSSLTAELVA